jgi:hypothetical protein
MQLNMRRLIIDHIGLQSLTRKLPRGDGPQK